MATSGNKEKLAYVYINCQISPRKCICSGFTVEINSRILRFLLNIIERNIEK